MIVTRLMRTGAILALCVTLLAGCLSKPSPETRFYVIDTVASGVEERPGQPVIEIASLRIPQYLDRAQLVTRPTAHRLQIHEYHRWGGNLRKSLTRLLAAELSNGLQTPQVLVVPHRSRMAVDFRVSVEVQRFELGPDQRVTLAAVWRLVDASDKTVFATQAFDQHEPVADSEDMDQVVAGMALLFRRLADGLVAQIRQQQD